MKSYLWLQINCKLLLGLGDGGHCLQHNAFTSLLWFLLLRYALRQSTEEPVDILGILRPPQVLLLLHEASEAWMLHQLILTQRSDYHHDEGAADIRHTPTLGNTECFQAPSVPKEVSAHQTDYLPTAPDSSLDVGDVVFSRDKVSFFNAEVESVLVTVLSVQMFEQSHLHPLEVFAAEAQVGVIFVFIEFCFLGVVPKHQPLSRLITEETNAPEFCDHESGQEEQSQSDSKQNKEGELEQR